MPECQLAGAGRAGGLFGTTGRFVLSLALPPAMLQVSSGALVIAGALVCAPSCQCRGAGADLPQVQEGAPVQVR